MVPEPSSRTAQRWWLVALVLVCVASSLDAQGRKGSGKNRARPGEEWTVPHETKAKLPPLYLPGFDSSGKGSKTPAPVGPKPKSPTKAEPNKPPDPMKEADQITAAADHRSAVEVARAQVLGEHFRLCDLDASGWLSLREAQVTLSLERGEFRRMDANQDGRLDPAEFSAQGEQLLARLGARPASPILQPALPEPPSEPRADVPAEPGPEEPATAEAAGSAASAFTSLPVRPRDLLARYDGDQSGGVDASEIEKLLLEAGLALSPELVVAQMDPDDSGQLEASELVAIAWMVSRHVPDVLRPPPEPAGVTASAALRSGVPAPTRDPGLATHFGLLDAGADGFIDEADLRALQGPDRLDLRLRALLSAMDQDGDGRLSEAEFQASMGARPR